MMHRWAALGFGLVVASGSALAQPTVLPQRDVTVVYRIEGGARAAVPGGLPETATASWSVSRQALRLQGTGRPEIMLLSFRTARLEVLDTVLHSVISLKIRERDLDPVRLQGASFTQLGVRSIAGLSCTDWAVAERRGNGQICLTADGVPLRASGTVDGRDGSFTAVSVTYGPVAATLFDAPASYVRFPLPSFERQP